MADMGGAILMGSAIAGLCLLFGAVVVRLFHGYFVDQTLGCGEAMALTMVALSALALTVFLWGTPLMLLPGLAGLAATVGWQVYQRTAERRAEAEHWLDEERKARALLARDPGATVGYDRLAEALSQQGGRTDEIIIALSEWYHLEPWNPQVVSRLNDLRPPDAPRFRVAPRPEESVEARPARDLGAADLDAMLGHEPVAPPPTMSEEELLAQFSPDNDAAHRAPDLGLAFNPEAETDEEGFGGTGVDPELRPDLPD